MYLIDKFKKYLVPTGSEERIGKLKELRSMFITATFAMSFLFSIIVFAFMGKQMGMFGTKVQPEFQKNIAVLHLNEAITVENTGRIIEKLGELEERIKDGSFSHLLIVASSPGGSPQGSEELARYLEGYQKKVPTTVYIQEVCASGCYYIVSAIQHEENNPLSGLIANPNAVVGSIGVVMPHFVYGPALERLGLQNEYLVEGEHKVPIDAWSLASEDAKAYMKKNLLGPIYKNFQDIVKQYRGFTDEQMSELNGGRIFLATLVEGTLVDRISNLTQVKAEIKASVEAKYPENEVGFVTINTAPKPKMPFSTSLFSIDKVELNGLGNQLMDAQAANPQYKMY